MANGILIQDEVVSWRRAVKATAHATATSFVNPALQLAAPDLGDQGTTVNGGIHLLGSTTNLNAKLAGGGVPIPRLLCVCPGGTGSDNDTAKIRIWGWKKIDNAGWKPTLLMAYTYALSTLIGVTDAAVVSTYREADDLTLEPGVPGWTEGTNVWTFSPNDATTPLANISSAHFIFDLKGHNVIDFRFDRNSSATGCNALWYPLG